MNLKTKKLLLEYRKGKVALKQMRSVQRLLDEAGVPEFVDVSGDCGNGPHIRLKWFIMRRKDVAASEVDNDVLTKEERAAIAALIPYGFLKPTKETKGTKGGPLSVTSVCSCKNSGNSGSV